MKELHEILRQLTSQSGEAVLATLVSVAGSSYRRAGARLLVMAGGEHIGSISGGCLEEDLMTRARKVQRTGRAELVAYDTTTENDLVWGVGLGCHGVVQVLIEKVPASPRWAVDALKALSARRPIDLAVVWQAGNPDELGTRLASPLPASAAGAGVFRQTLQPPPALTVFGAGDDARPLVRFAAELGWHVTVADPRASHATPSRFPDADRIVVAPLEELVARALLEPGAAAVIMSHRYVHDLPVLRALVPRQLAYIGLLGPRQRAERMLADLAREGVVPTAEQIARLHAPVGLDLGGDNAEAVALSVVAEIQAVLAGRDGRPLRTRTQPIHA